MKYTNQKWFDTIKNITNSKQFIVNQIKFDDDPEELDEILIHHELNQMINKLTRHEISLNDFKTYFCEIWPLSDSDFDFWYLQFRDLKTDTFINYYKPFNNQQPLLKVDSFKQPNTYDLTKLQQILN